MTAAKIVLEPIFEADFRPASFGYRPKRSAHQALDVIRIEANRGRDWVLDADITDCFGSISHEAIMAQLARRVFDKEMLKLVRAWVKQGVLEGGVVTDPVSGTPQGSPISPLLSNIALNVLDAEWEQQGRRIGVFVRYSDDFVILCASKERAEQARQMVMSILSRLGLQLPTAIRVSTSSAFICTRWNRGGGGASGICRDGRPEQRWLPFEQTSKR